MSFSVLRFVRIDSSQCGSATDVDFQVLFSQTDDDFKTVANGGRVTDANGYDIAFFSDAGMTVPLDWELEFYDGATGEIIAWVRVPSVSHTADTYFYMAYGDAAITTDQSNPTGVWGTSAKVILHFNNLSGTTTSVPDSTGNYDFASGDLFVYTTPGSWPAGVSGVSGIPGQIHAGQDVAASFGGNPHYGLKTSQTGLPTGSNPWTMSCWYNRMSGNNNTSLFGWGDNVADGRQAHIATGANVIGVAVRNANAVVSQTNDSNWHHLVIVLPSGQTTVGGIQIYLNGAAPTVTYTNGSTTFNLQSSVELAIATLAGAALAGAWYQGRFDEIRLWDAGKSASWVLKEYNNQKTASTFLTLGAASPAGGYVTLPLFQVRASGLSYFPGYIVAIDTHDGNGFQNRTPYVRVGSPTGPGISLDKHSGSSSSASFQVTDVVGGYVPEVGDSVEIRALDGTLMFSGFIDSLNKNTQATGSVFYDVKCVDAGVVCGRRRIGATYIPADFPTYADIIQDLVYSFIDVDNNSPIFFDYAAFVASGLNLAITEPVTFPLIYASEALSKIGEAIGADWYIDELKQLQFFNPDVYTACPVDFDDTNPVKWRQISVQESTQSFANRVTVKTNTAVTASFTSTFPNAGDFSGSFFIGFPLTAAPTVTVDAVNAIVVAYADTGANPGYEFYWQGYFVVRNPALPALTTETVAVISATPFPGAVFAQDNASILADGIFDYIIEAPDVNNLEQLQAIADGMLARLLTRPKDCTIVTTTNGIRPGMRARVNIAALSTDDYFIVQGVSSKEIDSVVRSGFWEHSLTLSTNPNQGSGAAAFMKRLISKGRTTAGVTGGGGSGSGGGAGGGPTASISFDLAPTVGGATNPGLQTGIQPGTTIAPRSGVAAFIKLYFSNLLSGAATTTTDILVYFQITRGTFFPIFIPTAGVTLPAGQSQVTIPASAFPIGFGTNRFDIQAGDIYDCLVWTADAVAMDGKFELWYY